MMEAVIYLAAAATAGTALVLHSRAAYRQGIELSAICDRLNAVVKRLETLCSGLGRSSGEGSTGLEPGAERDGVL